MYTATTITEPNVYLAQDIQVMLGLGRTKTY
jgi:hypothetical protein